MSGDEYYEDMKELVRDAPGYVVHAKDEEPEAVQVSLWVNDTWDDERRTVISLEGYCGDHEFGVELTAEDCLKLSDLIWSELFKRGITGKDDVGKD